MAARRLFWTLCFNCSLAFLTSGVRSGSGAVRKPVEMKKRVLVVTGGGDCPGLNAVIRAIVKRASQEKDWEVIGSVESFNGVLREPTEIMVLDEHTMNYRINFLLSWNTP